MALLLSYCIVSCSYYRYKSLLTCCCLSVVLPGHLSIPCFGSIFKAAWNLQPHMQWIRTVGGCLELFQRRLKQLQFSTRTVMGTNAAADGSEITYLLGNISLYITLCNRASRTINTYHVGTFRHIHIFCIATEEFLFYCLHHWRITNSKIYIQNFW